MLILAALESVVVSFPRHLSLVIESTNERTTSVSDMQTRRSSFRQRRNGAWLITHSSVMDVGRFDDNLTVRNGLLDNRGNQTGDIGQER